MTNTRAATAPSADLVPTPLTERLAECGWKFIEFCWLKKLSPASFYLYTHEQQRGTVSSNSRFQTIQFQQNSAN